MLMVEAAPGRPATPGVAQPPGYATPPLPEGETQPPTCVSPSLPELIDAYLASCAARRLSPRTIEKYGAALRIFRGNTDPPTTEELEAELLRRGESTTAWTARTTWTVWRGFFRWAHRRHRIPDPTEDLAPPRIQTAARRIFTPEEVRRIWDSASTARDKGLVLVALDAGLRLGEIASLRKADIGRDVLRVNTNGQGDLKGCEHCRLERRRRAPFGKSGVRTVPVLEYTAQHLRSLGDSHHVWISEEEGKPVRNLVLAQLHAEGLGPTAIARELERRGYERISEARVRELIEHPARQKPAAPLSTDGVKQAFHRIMARAGIDGRQWGPHTFRHTMATRWIATGGPTAKLQRILGHKDPATTDIYIHLTAADLKRDHLEHSAALELGNIARLVRPRDPRRLRSAWSGVKAYVMNRDGRRCAECGSTEDLSLDHIFPRSLGGKNAPGNGRILCVPCNQAKGATVTV